MLSKFSKCLLLYIIYVQLNKRFEGCKRILINCEETTESEWKLIPGWNPCKPYAEDAPVLVERHAKVTNDAKLYLPSS